MKNLEIPNTFKRNQLKKNIFFRKKYIKSKKISKHFENIKMLKKSRTKIEKSSKKNRKN